MKICGFGKVRLDGNEPNPDQLRLLASVSECKRCYQAPEFSHQGNFAKASSDVYSSCVLSSVWLTGVDVRRIRRDLDEGKMVACNLPDTVVPEGVRETLMEGLRSEGSSRSSVEEILEKLLQILTRQPSEIGV